MSSPITIQIRDGQTIASRRIKAPKMVGRNFAAAAVSRFNSDWTTDVLSIDDALEKDLRKLVARSREQRRNNDFVKHFDSLSRVNIIGKSGVGIRPKPKTAKNKADEQAKTAVTEAWKKWGLRENCDFQGKLSWFDMQNQTIYSQITNGEFLARKIFGGDAGPFGFQLQTLDPQCLDPAFKRELPSGGFIKLSIEFDKTGRVVAYWIRSKSRTASFTLPTIGFNGAMMVRVPASEIVHVFCIEEVGQKRGVPWVATALLRLRMLEAYSEAALIAARVGANKVAFITKPKGRGYVGQKDADGKRTMEATPGTIEELEAGSEVMNWDPTYPHGDFDPFISRCLKGIASGLLVSYSTLANDQTGSSFSSERARKQSETAVWSMFQIWLIDHFIRPVFEEWLAWALMFGQVKSGGRTYRPSDYDRLVNVEYQPFVSAWAVNPLQEATARKLEVDAGFRSRDDVILSAYGRDPADVDAEIKASQERAESEGINLSGPSTIAISVSEEKGDK